MAYKKVYYDEIWNVTSNGAKLSDGWSSKLSEISKKQKSFTDATYLKGKAADSSKTYFKEVHSNLISALNAICQTYMVQASDYYYGYKDKVDSGDGSDFGLRYTTIVYSEVNGNGKVPQNIKKIKNHANTVANDALRVKREIADLVGISSPKLDNLINQLNRVAKKATEVSDRVENYERSRNSDFTNIDNLIRHAQNIINHQLSANRYQVTSYVKGSIGSVTDFQDMSDNLDACRKTVDDFVNSDHYKEAMALSFNRDEMIKEEEKADREWAKWIAVGVAVVGSIVVIVVTAGTATPLVCAGVGAAVGLTTAATNAFVDNYIENGSLTEGMDWSDFGKECVIGAVTGAISGYIGGSSTGSVIKQPIEKALYNVAGSIVENGAEGLINTTWDLGEAIIEGKPGSEILSILEEDTKEMVKDIFIDGATEFATGYVGGNFDVDSSKKGYFKKLGEEIVGNATDAVVSNLTESVWDVGEALVDVKSIDELKSVLSEEAEDFAKSALKDFTSDSVSSIFTVGAEEIGDKIDTDNAITDVLGKTAVDTLGNTGGTFTGALTSQIIDIKLGDRDSIDIKEIWDKELDDGRVILTSAGNSLGKHGADEYFKDEKFYNSLLKKDRDGDGNVDVVVFDKYMVLKEDYDAAVECAGKGAYKDKTVQDILGLPKNTAISERKIKQETISINQLQKSDYKARKTTNVTRMDYKVDYDQVKEELFDQDLFENNKAGEYTYMESENGKTASGYLKLEKGERDLEAQRTVGGDDRKKTDDGGHLIGTLFDGSGTEENLDAQDSNVNRSAYKKKETEWANAIKDGKKVYVHVETHKNEGSDRPTEYMGYAIIENKDGTRTLDPFVFKNKKNSKEEEWVVFEK